MKISEAISELERAKMITRATDLLLSITNLVQSQKLEHDIVLVQRDKSSSEFYSSERMMRSVTRQSLILTPNGFIVRHQPGSIGWGMNRPNNDGFTALNECEDEIVSGTSDSLAEIAERFDLDTGELARLRNRL